MYDRREFLRIGIGTALGVSALPRDVWSQGTQPKNMTRRMTVYKTPTCGCCQKWVEHIKQTGWIIDVKDLDDLTKIKDGAGIPESLRSCHTSIVGRYAFEGHVPADLIIEFMERPRGVHGLAVPGMPTGAPGMEVPGRHADRYQVMGYYRNGRTFVYASR